MLVVLLAPTGDEHGPPPPPHQLNTPPPSAEVLFAIVELTIARWPGVPVIGFGPKFWTPPESPPLLFENTLALPDTSELEIVIVPPSLETPPPEPAVVVPAVIQSWSSVNVARLRTLAPNPESLTWPSNEMTPSEISRPEITTLGIEPPSGMPMSNTRAAPSEA